MTKQFKKHTPLDTKETVGLRVIRILDRGFDGILLIVLVSIVLLGLTVIHDNYQTLQTASANQYEQYNPSNKESFARLVSENNEVFGWINVYGTGIDYPMAQAQNNYRYVSTDAHGKPSLSGAIFLDSESSQDFSDFNSIIYGHHMAEGALFGDLDRFAEKGFLESHKYGELYTLQTDRYYGVEFFAYIAGDAYDWTLYNPTITNETDAQIYLDYVLSNATQTRDLEVSIDDKIVVLSTCAVESTNGRHLLIGVISDERFENEFESEEPLAASPELNVPLKTILIIIFSGVLLISLMVIYVLKQRQ